MTPPTPVNSPARVGRSAIEDTLGEWLNGNHQAEVQSLEDDVDILRRTNSRHLNQAIQYYNSWSSLNYQIGTLIRDVDILMEFSDLDDPARQIMATLRENMRLARMVAVSSNNIEVIDLTTDEDISDGDEYGV